MAVIPRLARTWPASALALALLCAAAGPALAQRIYKSVGPDGRVTFTDKPPAGEVATPLSAPAAPAAAPPAAADAATERPGGAKKAMRKESMATAPAATAQPAAIDPALEKGVFVLMGYESIVAEYLDLCLKTLPTSFKRYDGAAQKWKDRHAAVLARYPQVLRDHFNATEQAALRTGVQNRTRGTMAPVFAADTARKIKWCDDNAKELDAGKLDLAQNHASTLLAYQGRR